MKGRTVESLLRNVAEWHGELARAAKNPKAWAPNQINIKPYKYSEGQGKNVKTWTFNELLTSIELSKEGKEMKHCVGSYSGSCATGTKSVWSLKKEAGAGMKRVLTVAVDIQSKMIRELRGSCNRLATAQELSVVRRWAGKNNLSIGGYV